MPTYTADEIAKLPANIRQQIEAAEDKPRRMSNKARARQQWKPKQAQEAAERQRQEWRALTEEQREIRRVLAVVRQADETLHDVAQIRYEKITGTMEVAVSKQHLTTAIEKLEDLLA